MARTKNANQYNAPTMTSGDAGWVVGGCGHTWWAYQLSATVGFSLGKGYHGRKCPTCGVSGPVKQAPRQDRCQCPCGPAGHRCGAVLSRYNRSQDRCQPCLREHPLPIVDVPAG